MNGRAAELGLMAVARSRGQLRLRQVAHGCCPFALGPSSRKFIHSLVAPLPGGSGERIIGKVSKHNPLVLDGGTGSELMKRLEAGGHTIEADGSWSAGMMMQPDGRELLIQVHLDYLRAGAKVLTANTYSVTPATALTLQKPLSDLVQAAVDSAREARDRFVNTGGDSVLIAGSVPPLRGSFLPETLPDDTVLEREYHELLGLLAPEVDVLQIETLSCVREAIVCVRACLQAIHAQKDHTGIKQVWLGVAVYADGRLPSGEPIETLLDALFSDHSGERPAALNFNCSTFANIEVALQRVRRWEEAQGVASGSAKSIRLGAYPNRIVQTLKELKDAAAASATADVQAHDSQATASAPRNGDPEVWRNMKLWEAGEGNGSDGDAFASELIAWNRRYGVELLGGCCHFEPAHIETLASAARVLVQEHVEPGHVTVMATATS